MYNFINEEKLLTTKLIKDVILKIIEDEKLEDYCKKILFLKQNIQAFSFSNFERSIKLPNNDNLNKEDFLKSIINRFNDPKNIYVNNDISTNNLFTLFAVIHELEHSKQQKKVEKNYKNYNPLYIKNLISSIVNMHFRTYFYLDHDKAFHEYDANINAIDKIINLNKEYNFKNIEGFNQYAALLILRSSINDKGQYESPLSMNNKLTKEKEEYTKEKFLTYLEYNDDNLVNLYKVFKTGYNYSISKQESLKKDLKSRIMNGDNLSEKEIKKLYSIANGEEVTKDLFKELEKLKSLYTTPNIIKGEINDLFNGRKK